jgi:uncharacterized protein
MDIIDCDLHAGAGGPESLRPYLSEHWWNYGKQGAYRAIGYPGTTHTRQFVHGARVDSWPPDGGLPASDFAFLQEHHLDRWNIAAAMLTPMEAAYLPRNADYARALCAALNEWQCEQLIDRDARLGGSLMVVAEDADAAEAEIRKWAGDARFRQVLIYSRTSEPLGRRRYWRMFAAAAEAGLPVGVHFGLCGGGAVTGHGKPSFYVEDHTNMSTTFQDQVTSMVCEGVFAEFPNLRVVLIEGGLGWLTPLMWRLDRAWKLLRAEVPHLRELPSTVVRKHFWLTTQPIEEPPTAHAFDAMIEEMGMDRRIMFSTDYPHWDFDAPSHALPKTLSPDLRRRIFADNARALYGFSDPSQER